LSYGFHGCAFPRLWANIVIHSTAGIEAAEMAMEPGKARKQTLSGVEEKNPFSFAPTQNRILRVGRLPKFPYRCGCSYLDDSRSQRNKNMAISIFPNHIYRHRKVSGLGRTISRLCLSPTCLKPMVYEALPPIRPMQIAVRVSLPLARYTSASRETLFIYILTPYARVYFSS
jgi:hypothetical protein